MLDNETKRRIDTARDVLVGKVPDPKSQVEQITIALIYKFMDDMDKEAVDMGGKASFFVGDYSKYAWSKIFAPQLGGFEMLALYTDAITRMSQNPSLPQLFRDIFKNAYLPYRDPETLKLFLKTINEFNYDHSEKLGDAFEYLLSVLGSQGDAGQFRTPRHIIDFMVQVVAPQKNETILDPACGTAGFLISSFKYVLQENTKKTPGDKLTAEERKKLLGNFKGYDISPDMVRLSLVNLYLHGFVQPQILEYDTLTSEDRWNEYADVIMANPPFMSPKGGIKPHKKFSVQSNRSEVLFVDYIAEHLRPTGRAAVIVPEGIIFQSAGAYKQLRKMLVEKYLYAVVSLPAGVFNPYSGVKTSILFLDAQLNKKADSILFVKVENDGFGLGAQRREQVGSDLPDAANVIADYIKAVRSGGCHFDEHSEAKSFNVADKPCCALLVEKEKLAENNVYNLTGERYRIIKRRTHQKWPLVPIGELCELYNGKAFKPADWETEESGGLPIIRIQNLNYDKSDYNYFKGNLDNQVIISNGDLLFSWSGSRGTSFGPHIWKGQQAVLNQHIFKVVYNDLILKDFFFLMLKYAVKEIEENLHGGVGLVHITKGNLERIKIPLPPLEVQREIVSEIDGYQKLIDGARQVVENWKPQIQIDPSWPIVKLGQVFKLTSGKFLPQKDQLPGEHFVYGGNGISGKHNAYFLEKSTLIIGRVGEYCGAVHITEPKSWVTDNALLVAEYLLDVDQRYLSVALNNLGINNYAKRGGQPSISQSTVYDLSMPLPPVEIQREIVAKIEAERKAVEGCQELITIYEAKIKRVIDKVWEE